MSEKRTLENVKDKPTEDKLPPAKLVWEGSVDGLGSLDPARVVLRYKWVLPTGKEWQADPEYVYEVAKGKHALGEWRWEQHQLSSLPPQFFAEVLEAFDRAKKGSSI